MSFLQKFGYLQEPDPNSEASEALMTEEAVAEAISTMQRFGGIDPTGEIDNATLKVMGRPCPCPCPWSVFRRFTDRAARFSCW